MSWQSGIARLFCYTLELYGTAATGLECPEAEIEAEDFELINTSLSGIIYYCLSMTLKEILLFSRPLVALRMAKELCVSKTSSIGGLGSL